MLRWSGVKPSCMGHLSIVIRVHNTGKDAIAKMGDHVEDCISLAGPRCHHTVLCGRYAQSDRLAIIQLKLQPPSSQHYHRIPQSDRVQHAQHARLEMLLHKREVNKEKEMQGAAWTWANMRWQGAIAWCASSTPVHSRRQRGYLCHQS